MGLGPRTIALPESNAVFIWIPKVACSSLKAKFAGLEAAGADLDPHSIDFQSLRFPYLTWPVAARRRFTFAFVRNPWDRLASCYLDKVCGQSKGTTVYGESGVALCLERFGLFSRNMAFADFVDVVCRIPDYRADGHFRSQSSFLSWFGGHIQPDFVGRYECLQNDFDVVAAKLGLRNSKLSKLQTRATGSAGLEDLYTPEVYEKVRARYEEDVTRFGY